MMSLKNGFANKLKRLLIAVSAFVIVIAFQNCGQNAFQSRIPNSLDQDLESASAQSELSNEVDMPREDFENVAQVASEISNTPQNDTGNMSPLQTSVVTGATYYVSTAGSDSNSCAAATSASKPKRTLMGSSGGVSCLKSAGQTLVVRSGIYNEIITNNSLYTRSSPSWPSGISWSSPITVKAYAGEKVVISGIRLGHCCKNKPLPKLSYWVFSGFTLRGPAEAQNDVDYVRISNNDISGFNYNGITLYGVNTGIQIIGNKVHDNKSDCVPGHRWYGIYFNKSINALIEGNEFYNMPGGGIQLYNSDQLPRARGTIIRNNVIRNNNWCSTSNVGGMWIGHADKTMIYNNLIYNNGTLRDGVGVGQGISIGISSDTKVFNNVVYGNKGRGILSGGTNALGLVIQNNIVWNNSAQLSLKDPNIVTKSRNICNSGCDVNKDPKFVNAGAFNFRLQSASPAINAGLNLFTKGVTTDFAKRARPQTSAFEIGAYEY